MGATRGFWLVLAGFLVIRLLQASSIRGTFDLEEGFTLAAAWELLTHPVWPVEAYQITDWEGGSLWTVALTLPFIWLFGPCLFALKLTGLTLAALTLRGIYGLCREVWGERAGLFASLLYAAFPAPIYPYSLVAHGFHPDSMALQMLFLVLFVRASKAPDRKDLAIGAGVLGGLALHYAYISGILLVAAIGPCLLARARRRPATSDGPPLRWLGLGLLIGSLPLIAYNLATQGAGLRTYHGSLLAYVSNPAGLGASFEVFVGRTLPMLFSFSSLERYGWTPLPDYPHYRVFDIVFWVLALAALIVPGLRRVIPALAPVFSPAPPVGPVHQVERMVLLYFGLTLVIFFQSGHPVEPWHLVPLLVLLLCLIGGRLAQLSQALRGRRARGQVLGMVLLSPALLFGLFFNLRDLGQGQAGISLSLDGRYYSDFLLRVKTLSERRGDIRMAQAVNELELMLPEEHNDTELPRCLLLYMAGLEPLLAGSQPVPEVRALARDPRLHRPGLEHERLLGQVLACVYKDRRIEAARLLAQVSALEGPGALVVAETLGVNVGRRLLEALGPRGVWQRLQGSPGIAQAFAFGVGRATHLLRHRAPSELYCPEPEFPQPFRVALTEGLGFGTARRMVRTVPRALEAQICPPFRAAFRRGLDAFGMVRPVLLPRHPFFVRPPIQGSTRTSN